MKPFIYFALLIISMIVIALFPNSRELLELHPNTGVLQEHQWWRWLSGHFTHASWTHLGLNLLNLIVIRIIFIQWPPTTIWLLLVLFSALMISAGLILTSPLESYVGFSGIFYSLLIYFLLHQWHTQKLIYSTALIIIIGKIVYEQIIGPSRELELLIGINVASDAHAWGAMAGGIFWSLQRWFQPQNAS